MLFSPRRRRDAARAEDPADLEDPMACAGDFQRCLRPKGTESGPGCRMLERDTRKCQRKREKNSGPKCARDLVAVVTVAVVQAAEGVEAAGDKIIKVR